jgi:glycosyltransferase involved in cell wall biosynthesis
MTLHPVISVCIFSYNFGPYIEQAIESVLSQRLSVPYEIIIGDDKSTDNSAEIIKRYEARCPEIVRAIFNPTNIGGTANWLQTISLCRGKYIAFLDGDDYYIDDRKLQKQYEVMEADRGAVLCFHGVREVYDDPAMGKNEDIRFRKNRYNAGEILEKGWFIRTGSLFFRNGLLPATMPDWVFKYPYRLDSILPVFLTINGDAVYIDEICSVWRKHSRGMSYQLLEDQIKDAIVRIQLAKDLDNHSAGKYSHNTEKRLSALYTGLFFAILRSGSIVRHFNLFLKSLVRLDYAKAYRIVKRSLIGVKKT